MAARDKNKIADTYNETQLLCLKYIKQDLYGNHFQNYNRKWITRI